MRKNLRETLSGHGLGCTYNSYDILGDMAILRVPEAARKYSQIIAEAVMNVHKNVKTVLAQTSPVRGDFRTRELEFIAGENKTTTVHKESGCLFFVNVEKCYFSPRLSHERMRIAEQVKEGEVIVNMFAGVGCFSIIIAKHSNARKVYSIDINPVAVQNMQENIRLNNLYAKVVPIVGDAREVVERRLCHIADRILMPLPEKAHQCLPYALLSLKKTGGWIHYYDFEHALKNEDPVAQARLKVSEKLESLGAAFEIPFGRCVRTTGPNWHQIVLDVKIDALERTSMSFS
jgi:tRNA (guanine37-N1)-methyltransferase